MKLTATQVDAVPEDDESLALLYLKDKRVSGGAYVVLSRYTDDQDDGTIDLEVCEQTRRTSRGILKCRLLRDTLVLTVDADSAAALQTEPSIEITFDADDDLHESMRATLRSIFRDRLEMLEES